MAADLSIQNAFLDGMEEVYKTLFTEEVDFSFLDETASKTNVYDETPQKVYCEPIRLVGKVSTDFKQGEQFVEGIHIDCTITIPTKQLISAEIPRKSYADLERLRKGRFFYKGYNYLVKKVAPRTLVADEWHFYEFSCYVDTMSSLSVSDPLRSDGVEPDNEENRGLGESGSDVEDP